MSSRKSVSSAKSKKESQSRKQSMLEDLLEHIEPSERSGSRLTLHPEKPDNLMIAQKIKDLYYGRCSRLFKG